MSEREAAVRPDRQGLVDLCRRGVVPESKWRNRDSSGAQMQLGQALVLLQAGCEFRFATDPKCTDETWWVEVTFQGFGYFDHDGGLDEELFYIPTAERLERVDGRDWY